MEDKTKKKYLKIYKTLLETNDSSSLDAYNLLKGGDTEIQFYKDIIYSTWGKEISGGKMLDVACGIGYMQRCFNKQGFETFGFDVNKDAVSIAKRLDPGGKYYVADVLKPHRNITNKKYDFILFREVPPLSRIQNDSTQRELISKYLDLLSSGGYLVIAHARFGGGLKSESISFDMLKLLASEKQFLLSGPLFMFFYKLLSLRRPSRLIITFQSFLSLIWAKLSIRSRLIQVLIIHKI